MMQAILVLLLAAILAPDATRVALDRDGWPVDDEAAAHATWWWSATCAPQKLQRDETPQCRATRRLLVHVVDAKGRPIPGANVTWGGAELLRDVPDDRLPSAIATEDGVADIAAPASEEIWLRATSANSATAWTRAAGGAGDVRLTAFAAKPLRITLRGEDGKPVLRGRVALIPPDCTRLCPERLFAIDWPKKGMTVTVARGVTVRVAVWSDSHAPLTRTIAAPDGDLTLDLPAGGALDARLVDEERKGVRAATLDVQYRLPELNEIIRRGATANVEGNASLAGLPPSFVEWTAAAPAKARRVDQATLTAGSATNVGEIVLRPAREVKVAVRDGAGGAVGGAQIVARGVSHAATDAKGIAVLRDLPSGEIALQITADGFITAAASIAKADRELAVTLARGAAVKATLLRQSDGKAPEKARVRITNNGRQTLQNVDLAQGFFVSGLRGGNARMSIAAEGAQPYDTGTLTVVDGQVLDLGIITLPTGFTVRGTVVDDHAAPLAGARVRLLRTAGDSPALAHVLGNWSEAASADDGTFHIDGLAGGSQFIVVEARGFAQRVLTNVAVDNDQPVADVGSVALETGRTVELICRPERRCGTEGSILFAGSDYPFLVIRAPLQRGRATFNAVPSGTSTLRLTRNQHITHERSVDVASGHDPAPLEIDLPSVSVRGEVAIGSRMAREGSLLFTRAIRSSGLPIMINGSTEQGTTIDKQWLGSFGASVSCELTASGEFRIDDLEPGPWEVVFRSNGASTATIRVDIPDVPEHQLRLRFDSNEIAGTVYDAASRPAAVRIDVVDAAGASHSTRSGVDGAFRLLGVSGGRARVKATTTGKSAATEVDPADSVAQNVVLRLEDDRSSGLTVDVCHADGSPAAGVLVFAMANSGVIAGSTDREGRASLPTVSGEGIALAVHEPGGRWAFANGRAGENARLMLPTHPGAFVATSADATGEAAITAPNGFPLDRVLPMIGISSRLGSGGSLRVPGLPPGAYDVALGAFHKGVTIAPGAVAEVRFGN
ncbi:MAG TPA: carboxypeptidase regulatory-like domain-containing protein [Thermoanaerobaculia bacterium]|nr:carboxypeptidase regulatory-like domain-containing protein [Thermoanaerobaculia bacterium]